MLILKGVLGLALSASVTFNYGAFYTVHEVTKSLEDKAEEISEDTEEVKAQKEEVKKQNKKTKAKENKELKQLKSEKKKKVKTTTKNKPKKKTKKSQGKTITVRATAYTAYCKGCSGTTYTGQDLRANPNLKIIAVDPNVIPLGSRVHVEGYGEALAGDIGGAINGHEIDVFIPNQSEAVAFGVKTLKVTIID